MAEDLRYHLHEWHGLSRRAVESMLPDELVQTHWRLHRRRWLPPPHRHDDLGTGVVK